MSTEIDQKIVEMQFNNKQFENNVQTSLSTLEKLKKGLNLSDSAKGLTAIGDTANKMSFTGLTNGIEAVRLKFSALEVMSITALANITNSAVNAGKRIVSALTIDPIKTGFSEYETKINSIQTILSNTSSKGTTMADVTRVIGELNTYADKTIYNFAEMTRNVGTFTAAGIDLDKSAKAIQGIANLAASSGSNSQQASTAMYQLSQALASGTVKLMDWNSVINAGMGGEKFQNALKETAKRHGVAVEKIIKDSGSFRDSLQSGWITADILNETLNNFTVDGATNYAKSMMESGKWTQKQADALIKEATAMEDAATKVKTFTQLWDTLKEAAQSGWSQSWELIIGNFEEAKSLLTNVSNVIGGMIGASADARNELLTEWGKLGGRTALIDSFRNTFESVIKIITPIKEAFREIFPPTTAKQLVAFTEGLKVLTSKLKISNETADKLKRTFKGVFAILDIAKQAFSAVFDAIKPLFGGVSELGGGILGITASWGDWLVKLDETIKKGDLFNKILSPIVETIKRIATAIKDFIQNIKAKIEAPGIEFLHAMLERVHDRMSSIGDAAGGMKSATTVAITAMGDALEKSKFFTLLETLWKGVTSIVGGISKILGGLVGGFVKKLGNTDFSGAIDAVAGISLGAIGFAISNFIKSLSGPLDSLSGIGKNINGILNSVKDTFKAYQAQLKAGVLLKIAIAIGILTASLVVISLIDSKKLAESLAAIGVLFGELITAMALYQKIGTNVKGAIKACASMVLMSTAILILSAALKNIASLDTGELVKGLVGIAVLSGIMVASAKIISSGKRTVIKGATQMVIFAAAIKILASACTDLSKLNYKELTKGLIGVGVLLTEISLFLRTAKFSGKSVATATGIVILAAAIKILGSACKDFAQMSVKEIIKGLGAIGVLLAEITLFTRFTSNAKHVVSTGVALIAIGAAMKILASALKDFASLSLSQIGKGLLSMAGALTAITIALRFMPKNTVGLGVGLIAVSTALLILSKALSSMGNMSWTEIAKGLTALGGAIAILAIGLNFMKGTLSGSAALLVAATALAILTPVLSILGAMSWKSIAKGLTAIAGVFVILGVAGLVLTPVIPAILALSGALALLGVGVVALGAGLLLVGVGLSAIAIGITALSAAVAAGATGIVASLSIIIMGLIDLIPAIGRKIGEGIIELAKAITEGIPAIGKAVEAIILTTVKVLSKCVPEIVDGVLEIVEGVLVALVKHTPKIVDSVFKFLIAVLDGIARNLPALIKSAVKVVMAFFSGVVDALKGIDTNILLKGLVGVGLLSGIMIALSAVAALVPGAMLGVLGMGGVIAELALVLAAIGAISKIPGLSWLINEGGKFMQDIGTAIGSFIGGIIGGVMGGISAQFPKIGTDLSNFMTNIQPFVDGAKNIDQSAMAGVKALAEIVLILTAANILEGLTSWFTGGSSLTKFGKELSEFGPYFRKYYDSVKGMDGSVVEASANAAKAIAEFAREVPNSGGLVSLFTGDNTLSKFANELVAFGPSLKKYADSVQGLDASVVTNSANAAKTIIEFAREVPNSGGLISLFTGDNTLSKFSNDLVKFGPSLKKYADSVKGLDASVVNNSANAAKTIVEFSREIPNSGGLISLFTGDNKISKFGKELAVFGPNLKAYADSVMGLDSNVVINSSKAAETLIAFSREIPNSGGLVSLFTGDNNVAKFGANLTSFGQNFATYANDMKTVDSNIVTATSNAAASIITLQKSLPKEGGWFVDNATLADFGKDMSSFGSYFGKYYESICNINTSTLSGVIAETNNLVAMAKGMGEINTKTLSSFGKALASVGEKGITDFINTFTNAKNRAIIAASEFVGNFVSGINAKTNDIKLTITNIISTALTSFDEKKSTFYISGNQVINEFIKGIKSVGNTVSTTLVAMLKLALYDMSYKYVDFVAVGGNMVNGFVAGISANTYKAAATAKAMALAAVDAAKKELDIHSPSKVFYAIGGYAGQGFVNAFSDYGANAYQAGSGIANAAKEGLVNAISKVTDFINGDIDVQPTIRPVLDLSNVESNAKRMTALFSQQQAMSIGSSMRQRAVDVNQNEVSSGSGGIVLNYKQYNNSPKALSSPEIFRQTRNQLSAVKGLIRK